MSPLNDALVSVSSGRVMSTVCSSRDAASIAARQTVVLPTPAGPSRSSALASEPRRNRPTSPTSLSRPTIIASLLDVWRRRSYVDTRRQELALTSIPYSGCMEIGIYTFARADLRRGHAPSSASRDLIEEIELADQVGLDVFGVGEHHRPDFAVSRARPSSSAPPRRARAHPADQRGQRAQLRRPRPRLPGLRDARPALRRARGDHGRARLVHRVLPALRLRPRRLRRALRREARAAAADARVRARDVGGPAPGADRRPRASTRGRVQDPLPVWVAVGGSPQSAVRAGALGLPMALAIIGGMPERFAPLAELHRRAAERGGPPAPAISINSHGFIAETSQAAADESFPRLRRDDGPHRPRARLAADDAASSSTRRARCAARTSSAARRRSSRRSSSSTRSSGTSASSCR